MISFCPNCNTEQLVTAVMLQTNRGRTQCISCNAEFAPREHRLTPVRERAFKRSLKERKINSEVAAEKIDRLELKEEVLSQTQVLPLKKVDVKPQASLDVSITPSVDDVSKEALSRTLDKLNKTVESLGEKVSKAEMAEKLEQIKQSRAKFIQQKLSSQPKQEPFEAIRENIKLKLTKRKDNEKIKSIEPQRLPGNISENHSFTQKIAQQRLVLERQKLLIEKEKLQLEHSKLALEKEKLQLVKERMTQDRKADFHRPVIEYNRLSDLLPRTPTAIDHDRVDHTSTTLELELVPIEKNRPTFRRKTSGKPTR